jgi:hypothetical protein
MLEIPRRQFHASPAVRNKVPLWIGLFGPSGSGKTYTALSLAEGIASVQGGPIYGIDTEAGRMLHYADRFKFQHIPFGEPYGSLDYLAAIRFALEQGQATGKRPTIIVDSMSHEHEGPGGMMDLQDQIVRRMATKDGVFDSKKAERVKMLAWAEPKGKRRALINGMLGLEANFILCFRAKESSVPVQKVEQGNNGRSYTKTEVVRQGFVPIGGDDFVYECTLSALLLPGARGVPSWSSDLVGEAKMIKLPEQFLTLKELSGKPLDATVGANLAKWADGGIDTKAAAEGSSGTGGKSKGRASAEQWANWFTDEVEGCKTSSAVALLAGEEQETLAKLKATHPDLWERCDRAASARCTALDMA